MRMTSTEPASLDNLNATSSAPISKKQPSPRLSPPDFVRSNSLTAALYNLFSSPASDTMDTEIEPVPVRGQDSAKQLTDVFAADVVWTMPLFDVDARAQLCESFDQFFGFAISPTLTVYSVKHTSEQSFTFEWTLSFLYPLPWRPRVAVSATSTAMTDDNGRVVKLTDDWFVPPWSLVLQALPPLPDIMWLWPAPHAETDRGSRRVLKRTRHYSIVEMAARVEMRIRDYVEENSRELVYAVPALPEKAFEGGLRRKEIYSTVTPISIRHTGDGWFEWVIAAPGAHVGTSSTLMPMPVEDGVSLEVAERRVFAITRFGGYSRKEIVDQKRVPFVNAIKNDGLWEGSVEDDDIWVRVYNIKVGFNSSGLLAMAMYGHSKGVPRVNEIAVDITEFWDKEG